MRIFLILAAAATLSAESGLAAWWSFNDGAGKWIYDSSGLSNHARMRGASAWGEGRIGSGMICSGAPAASELSEPLFMRGTEEASFTITAWIKPEEQAGRERLIAGKSGFHAGLFAHTEKGVTTLGFSVWGMTGGSCSVVSSPVRVGEWHHIAVTYDARKITLYVNGIAAGNASFSGTFRDYAKTFLIGAAGNNSFPFKGVIDEVRVYRTALSAAQVAEIVRYTEAAKVEEVPGAAVPAVSLEKDRGELRTPLFKGKPVIAHYMTQMSTFGSDKGYYMNAVYGAPDGPASNIGGAYTYRSAFASFLSNKAADDAIEFEVRTAKRLGIDGFHFYYQSPDPDTYAPGTSINNDIIRRFFRVLKERNIDFKLTLCISHPNQKTDAKEKIRAAAQCITELMNDVKDSPHWLRAPDGRIIFFTWATEGYSDGVLNYGELFRKKDIELQVKALAEGYEALRRMIGVPAAFVYHVWDKDTMYQNARTRDVDFDAQYDRYIDAILDYFPAVTGFADYPADERSTKEWKRVSDECRRRGRFYGQAVMTDYVKTYKKVGKLPIAADIPSLKVNDVKMLYLVLPGAVQYRTLWQRAVDYDASFVSYVTWNDYPEGHHLAPEGNHNFAFAVLTEYFENIWRGTKKTAEDTVMAFFHKYPIEAEPVVFPVKAQVVPWHIGREEPVVSSMNIIDAAAILKAPGEVWVNGVKRLSADAGLISVQVPMTAGPVSVEIRRNGAVAASMRTPEWISEKPYRTDRLIYAYSSKCNAMYKELFGGAIGSVDEYAEDASGMPNWKKRYRLPDAAALDTIAGIVDLARWTGGSVSGMKTDAAGLSPVLIRDDKASLVDLSSGKEQWKGADDLSGALFLANDETSLFIQLAVRDDVHIDPPASANDMWRADSVQIGIARRDGSKNIECGAALRRSAPLFAVWKSPVPDADTRIEYAVKLDGKLRYTFRIPLDLFGAKPGDTIAVSALINDADIRERKAVLEFGQGIGTVKDPDLYLRYRLAR